MKTEKKRPTSTDSAVYVHPCVHTVSMPLRKTTQPTPPFLNTIQFTVNRGSGLPADSVLVLKEERKREKEEEES